MPFQSSRGSSWTSLLPRVPKQEKKEGRVLNFVRDKLHHWEGHLQTMEATNDKLSPEVAVWREWQTSIEVFQGGKVDVADKGDGGGVVEAEVGAGRWKHEV
jgi:hypothetical protein